jgi:hypothetical protein
VIDVARRRQHGRSALIFAEELWVNGAVTPPKLRLLPCALFLALAFGASRASTGSPLWTERFDAMPAWIDPMDHSRGDVARVYTVGGDLGPFLHAHHVGGTVPAIHFGKRLDGIALDRVAALRWRWRALVHPRATGNAWDDLAASVYVVIRTPSLFRSGKGFKFGWTAAPAPPDKKQHGILQVELRHEPASPEWKTESVDLCDLYRRTYGPCEGERVVYVGVVTDADNTKSVAEADYDDFELIAK